jgi:hypothetical protein
MSNDTNAAIHRQSIKHCYDQDSLHSLEECQRSQQLRSMPLLASLCLYEHQQPVCIRNRDPLCAEAITIRILHMGSILTPSPTENHGEL